MNDRTICELRDGVYHVSTPIFYKRSQWFLERISLNKAHIILYRNAKPVCRMVPLDTVVSDCEADYGLESPSPLK